MKIRKFFQYAYLVFALLFLYNAISSWNTDRTQSYVQLFLAATAIFVFFFRKHFNKKIEDQNNTN